MALTTTKILASINLKGALPEGRFTDPEILDLAYDVLISDVQPTIIGVREENFVEKLQYPILKDQAAYAIPARAAGQKLREVKILRGNRLIDLPQMAMEDVVTTDAGQPVAFYLESNNVVLYPTPSATVDILVLSYYLRCSKPVSSAEVAVVTAVDPLTGIVTASCPATWSIAESFDVTGRVGESLKKDLIATSVSPTEIVFSDTTNISVGSYVSLAGETFVLQIMEEAVPMLSMLTVVECLNSMGDLPAMQAAQSKCEQLRVQLIRLLTARVLGEARRFSPQI